MKTILQVLVCLLILTSLTFSQDKISLQFNGGVVSPFNSHSGLDYGIQLNYHNNPNNSFFINISNSSWNENKLVLHEPNGNIFNEHNEENHSLFSIFLGDRLTFYRIKTINTFFSFRFGYQKLKYTKIGLTRYINPDGSIEYLNDYSMSQQINDNLFGIGFGLGIMNRITGSLGIQLSVKLNSYINNSYKGLFSKQGTYLNYSCGLIFNI